jgi:flagellum-specific peptidoglycan hydrolase FlgJ
MKPGSQPPHGGTALRSAGALAIALGVTACASTPPAPTASLQAARQAISTAERADASRHAPEELSQARTKLASADEEVTASRMAMAERLAIESRASAELASARTSAAKAKSVNEEMMRSTDTLIEEMQRTSGDRP